MIVERSMNSQFLSNTYLVVRDDDAFFIDAGGPVQPLIEKADELGVTPRAVLLTHHHYDHVSELDALLERWPEMEVVAHPDEPVPATRRVSEGEVFDGVEALHTPGHTAGMLSFLVTERDGKSVFTGDTLFRNSVGGVRAPGHTTYEDLKRSIMDVLLGLPPDTTIHPGHTDPTTVEQEWETNAFVRIWRGLDPEGSEPCTALGDPATLVLLGDDYDGGHKAWVRWEDGADDIVPGSQVTTGP
jgi:glyoxylase-like metal-dependent hydrolase (beta-lactamase superfamily II)